MRRLRSGAGSIPWSCRIRFTVVRAISWPRFESAPRIRVYPHWGFSTASRTTSAAVIEALSPYESSRLTVEQACAALNVPQEAADFITRGLFRSDVPLHRHQFEAWERSRAGRPVIVTSGTGSGKTEAYLLPIFSSLVEECLRGWGVPQPVTSQRFWWRARRQERIPQRSHESAERRPAVRALGGS